MKFLLILKRRAQGGLTLVETIIGLAVIVLTVAAVIFALTQTNSIASTARLYTAAQFLVQNRIDQIQSDTPFVPQSSLIPAELVLTTGSNEPVTVYADPARSYSAVVSGTLTSKITDVSVVTSTSAEYAYQALVTLSYRYRNKTFTVAESTVRASDQ